MNTKPRPLKTHGGFTLLEVLLAVVILSIGLLGLAAMQMIGLRSNSTSSFLSQATILASDMTERMRANQAGMAAGAFKNFDSDVDGTCDTLPATYCAAYTAADGTTSVNATACSPTAMAAFDLNVIACGNRLGTGRAPSDGIVNALPGGRLQVKCNDGVTCPAPYHHVVTVSWNDVARDASGKTTQVSRSLILPVIP